MLGKMQNLTAAHLQDFQDVATAVGIKVFIWQDFTAKGQVFGILSCPISVTFSDVS